MDVKQQMSCEWSDVYKDANSDLENYSGNAATVQVHSGEHVY